VAIDLRVGNNGHAALHAFTLGKPYSIDTAGLSFTARPFGHAGATPHPLAVTIGDPVPGEDGRLQELVMPLTFGASPADGGLWDVELHAAQGFAKTSDGDALPFGDWSRPSERWNMAMWWPSRSDIDGLATLRTTYVGHDVYAYGGATLQCGPSVAAYDPAAPLPIVAIEREEQRVAMLGPGIHGGANDAAPRFVAIEPLRFVFRTPDAKHQRGYGGSVEGDGCPAIELADWQIDATFSFQPPPASLDLRPRTRMLHAGMTRADVAWLLGYPTEFAGRERMQRERSWDYDDGPCCGRNVVFRGDRVASFTERSLP
jgi:hypothetical protein